MKSFKEHIKESTESTDLFQFLLEYYGLDEQDMDPFLKKKLGPLVDPDWEHNWNRRKELKAWKRKPKWLRLLLRFTGKAPRAPFWLIPLYLTQEAGSEWLPEWNWDYNPEDEHHPGWYYDDDGNFVVPEPQNLGVAPQG